MNWSKKNLFVSFVARGAVGTKADAMAANTSSFAIIFALCVMAVDRAGMGADGFLSAAAQIKLARKPHVFPQLVELADNAIFERQRVFYLAAINVLERVVAAEAAVHPSIAAGIRAAHAGKLAHY